jgi:branched-chain amino acid transport system permease protein
VVRQTEREKMQARVTRGRVGVVVAIVLGLAVIVMFATDAASLEAAILGVGSGAMIAALALGILVTYKGSGVVNIGAGAMAMYSSYVFNSLNQSGKLLIVGWKISLGGPLAFLPALLITVIVAALWGLALYWLIFAPLHAAPPVAKLVASVGLLLVFQAIIVLSYGSEPQSVGVTLPQGALNLPDHIRLFYNELILAGLVVAAAIALWAVYRFTSLGLATRGAAENERSLVLLGRSAGRVSAGNWVFSSVVVSLFAVLTAALNGSIDPTTVTVLVVPALAAAMIGGLSSFGWVVVGGLGIGVVQALVQYLATKPWWPTSGGTPLPGVSDSIPFIIIVVLLFVRPATILGRGALGSVRLPFAPRPQWVLPKMGVAAALAIVGFLVLSPAWRLGETNTLIGIVVCLSLVVLTGFLGQVSLAQMAFAGFAGFTVAQISRSTGIGFPLAPILGALGATAVGLIAAVPALRTRGVQLAIVTLAASVAIENFVFVNPIWSNGVAGANVSAPSLFGWHFGPNNISSLGNGTEPDPVFGIMCVVVVVILAGAVTALRASPKGRRMLAIRANERAAAAAGIAVGRTKVFGFGFSAFIAGIAGALSGYTFGAVTSDTFDTFASLSFVAFAYMGGISSVTGAVIGGLLVTDGLVFTGLQRWFGLSPNYSILIGGLGLIATVVTNPDGIAGTWRRLGARINRRPTGGPGGVGGLALATDERPDPSPLCERLEGGVPQ